MEKEKNRDMWKFIELLKILKLNSEIFLIEQLELKVKLSLN